MFEPSGQLRELFSGSTASETQAGAEVVYRKHLYTLDSLLKMRTLIIEKLEEIC